MSTSSISRTVALRSRSLALLAASLAGTASCAVDPSAAGEGADDVSSTSGALSIVISAPMCATTFAAAESALRATGYPLVTQTVSTATYHEWTTGWAAPTGAGFYMNGGCVREVHGMIFDKWKSAGGLSGVLGGPITDEFSPGIGVAAGARADTFQHGGIYWSSATNAHIVLGSIVANFYSLNAAGASPGLPTSDEEPACFGKNLGQDRMQNFEKETLVWRAVDNKVMVDPVATRRCTAPLTQYLYGQTNTYSFNAFAGSAHSATSIYLVANDSEDDSGTWHVWRCPKTMADSCSIMADPYSSHAGDPDFDQASGLLYVPLGESDGSTAQIAVYRDNGGTGQQPARLYRFASNFRSPAWVAKSPVDGLIYVGGDYGPYAEPTPSLPKILQIDVYREPAWTNPDGTPNTSDSSQTLTLVNHINLVPFNFVIESAWWATAWPQGGAFGPDGVFYLGVDAADDPGPSKMTGVWAFDMRPWYEHVYDHSIESGATVSIASSLLADAAPGASTALDAANHISIQYSEKKDFGLTRNWEFEGVDVDGTRIWATLNRDGNLVSDGTAFFYAYDLH